MTGSAVSARRVDWAALRTYLEAHYRDCDYLRYRERDPVRFLEPYRGSPRALEVVGFLAAALAYGHVSIIQDHVAELLRRLGDPLSAVLDFDAGRARRDLAGFRHRFNDGRDVAYLLSALREVLERHGSLQNAVLAGLPPGATDLAPGLARFTAELAATDARPVFGGRARQPPASARYLFPSPDRGSTCKRLFMFARWMVRRPDAVCPVDHGVWDRVSPRLLLLPLDTHTGRIVRYLGLAGARRTLSLAMAREVTASLARLDPEDPVKYDFALAHAGISGACQHRRVPEVCSACGLEPVCRLGSARGRSR